MPRDISSALATELAKTITTVGYLVEIGFSSVRRWSNIGQVTWNSQTWQDVDFAVDGLSFDPDAPLSATLTIPNVGIPAGESVYPSALFIDPTLALTTIPITVYQFAYGALAVADVPKVAVMAIDGVDFSHAAVRIALAESKDAAAFSPRRKINTTNGFKFATPAGTVIPWQGEVFVAGPANG